MRTIEVDDMVYRHIQSQAIPFEEPSPNDTLKRLFGLKHQQPKEERKESLDDFVNRLVREAPATRTKAPKAKLSELIRRGLLAEDETISLVDYSGNRISTGTAHVAGSQLRYEGRQYSMSELARILLNKHGYQSQSVRGPAHWVTSNGKSIKDLWNQYQRRKEAEAGAG